MEISASRVPRLYQSTVTLKVIMAITGLIMLGILFVHMAGNLQIFAGKAGGAYALDKYAKFLKAAPALLWAFRIVLLTSLVLHVYCAITLWLKNRAARPVRYAVEKSKRATFSSKNMIWLGVAVALYLVYHLFHFTIAGVGIPGSFDHAAVHRNVIRSFKIIPLGLVYVFANLALGVHLWHGAFSWFQSLGLSHPKYDNARKVFAWGVTVVIIGGFIITPLAVMFGVVK